MKNKGGNMPKPRLAESLKVLRREIDFMFPMRSKKSEGWIGDAAHAKRKSFHNPDKHGVVCAIDVTHDPKHGADMGAITEYLRTHARIPLSHMIFNKRIISGRSGWKWVKYSGANQHIKHAHIAVFQNPIVYDLGSEWLDGYGSASKEVTPIDVKLLVNGKPMEFINEHGTIYVPLKVLTEKLHGVNGVKATLTWDAKTKTAKLTVRSK